MHNDKHCIKMILEYNQLLSTAHRILDGTEYISKSKSGRNVKRWSLSDNRDTILYSATHINHPSAVWVRKSESNYNWLSRLLVDLCQEYTYRYGKVHKCQSMGLVDVLFNNVPKNIPKGNFTEPTPAMDKSYIIPGDSVKSYRNYYNIAKRHLATWQGKINSRKIPEWYEVNDANLSDV